MSHYVITIKNWDKFNTVKKSNQYDTTSHSWFRMDNSAPLSNDLEGLSAHEKWLWIVLLCQASKKMASKFEARLTLLSRIAALEEIDVQDGLDRFTERGLIDFKILAPLGAKSASREGTLEPSTEAESAPAEGTFLPPEEPESASAGSENSPPTNQPLHITNITNDTNTTDTTPASAEAAEDVAPDIMELWNSNAAGLVGMKSNSLARRKSWTKRWNENPDLEYWIEVVKRMSASTFCCGTNDTGWRADIDFFLKPDTHIKVMEGKYDRGPQKRRQTHQELVSSANRELFEKVSAEPEAHDVQSP